MGLLQKIKENKMGEFNEAQVAAIKHKKGPMLVLAGAGSGKTTVLTYRIKNLIIIINLFNSSEMAIIRNLS